jgi:hypothetical protein
MVPEAGSARDFSGWRKTTRAPLATVAHESKAPLAKSCACLFKKTQAPPTAESRKRVASLWRGFYGQDMPPLVRADSAP